MYQCIESPHVTTINHNLGAGGNCGREELMPIEDLLVVVGHGHFHTCGERMEYISYDSSKN